MKNKQNNCSDKYHHVELLPRKDPDMVAARLRLLEKARAHTCVADRLKLEAYKSRLFSLGYVSMEHVTRIMDESFGHYDPSPYGDKTTQEDLDGLADCRHSAEEMEASILLEIAGTPLERLVSLFWYTFNHLLHTELCDIERATDAFYMPESATGTEKAS